MFSVLTCRYREHLTWLIAVVPSNSESETVVEKHVEFVDAEREQNSVFDLFNSLYNLIYARKQKNVVIDFSLHEAVSILLSPARLYD